MKSDYVEFTIQFIKKLITVLIITILGSNLMFSMDMFKSSDFSDNPYSFNPGTYMDSVFGLKTSSSTSFITMIISLIMGTIQKIVGFINSMFGFDLSKYSNYVDIRYENPFMLSNIYSWAALNGAVRETAKYFRDYILGYGSINKNISLVLYNLTYYFASMIFIGISAFLGIKSMIGMFSGISKNIYTVIPGYGTIYYIGFILLLLLSLFAFPVNISGYVIGIQLLSVFYYFFIKKGGNELMNNGFKHVYKYAKRAHWSIVIMILLALFRSSQTTLKQKDANYVLYVCITLFVLYVLYNGGRTVIKSLFTQSSQ